MASNPISACLSYCSALGLPPVWRSCGFRWQLSSPESLPPAPEGAQISTPETNGRTAIVMCGIYEFVVGCNEARMITYNSMNTAQIATHVSLAMEEGR